MASCEDIEHSKESFKENYFQSATKGQEFVVDANEQVIEWVKNIINAGIKQYLDI